MKITRTYLIEQTDEIDLDTPEGRQHLVRLLVPGFVGVHRDGLALPELSDVLVGDDLVLDDRRDELVQGPTSTPTSVERSAIIAVAKENS